MDERRDLLTYVVMQECEEWDLEFRQFLIDRKMVALVADFFGDVKHPRKREDSEKEAAGFLLHFELWKKAALFVAPDPSEVEIIAVVTLHNLRNYVREKINICVIEPTQPETTDSRIKELMQMKNYWMRIGETIAAAQDLTVQV